MTLPVAGCIGPRSYRTMREAWEAVQADRSPVAPIPFRCSVCRWWHTASRGDLEELVAEKVA